MPYLSNLAEHGAPAVAETTTVLGGSAIISGSYVPGGPQAGGSALVSANYVPGGPQAGGSGIISGIANFTPAPPVVGAAGGRACVRAGARGCGRCPSRAC